MLRLVIVLFALSLLIGCGASGPPRFPGTDDASGQWAEDLLGGPPEIGLVVRMDRIRESALLTAMIGTAERQLGKHIDEGDAAADAVASATEIQLYGRRAVSPKDSKDEWDDAYFVAVITGAPTEAGGAALQKGGWERQSGSGGALARYQRDDSEFVLLAFSNDTWVVANVPRSSDSPPEFSAPPRSALEPDALVVMYGQGRWVAECDGCTSFNRSDGALFGALFHVDAADDEEIGLGLRLLYENEEAAEAFESETSDSISEKTLQDQGFDRFAPIIAAVLDQVVTVDRDGEIVSVDVTIPSSVIALLLAGAAVDLW